MGSPDRITLPVVRGLGSYHIGKLIKSELTVRKENIKSFLPPDPLFLEVAAATPFFALCISAALQCPDF
jgi:hypothetical protein